MGESREYKGKPIEKNVVRLESHLITPLSIIE